MKNLVVESRDARILEVSGAHKPGRSDFDVATVYSFNSASKYIPKRLGFFFLNLKTLLITKSNLRLIEFRDFMNMKKLQKLYLPENKIEKLPLCIFKYVENLEIIDLSGNKIQEFNEDTFLNLPNLQQFTANDNLLMQLDAGLFRQNSNLKKIFMSHNNISVIEMNFMKMKDVEVVDLRGNFCIDSFFVCCKGLALKEFQNRATEHCKGSEDR